MHTPNSETVTCLPVAQEDFAEGRVEFDAFEVGEEVGKGGMAVIHRGREVAPPHRTVALKLIHSHLACDPDLVRRFEHEVRSQVHLAHPNIVEMVGWGRDARGRLFMAMEFVDGPALKEVLARGHRLPVDLAVHVVRSMVSGLQAAHARGVVHRDVKPANVMVTTAGVVKVADFGIAKAVDMTQLTSTGNVIGTPAYMSPEQALAKHLDLRSDLFSVGVVLHELLTGTNPFQTGNPATTLSRVVHHHQRPVFETLPQVPHVLEDLVDALLQKDALQRPVDDAAVLALLEACEKDESLQADAATFAEWLRDPVGVTGRLDAFRAKRHFDRGVKAFAGGKGNAEAALWEFFLATLLDPASTEARAWLEQVSKDRGYGLHARSSERITELETRLKAEPDDLPLVMQLAKLHKAQGNFLQVIYYYKRAKSLRPPDKYTQAQIETLVGAQAAPVIDGTAQFESCDFTQQALRPVRPPAEPALQRAEGFGDFLSGVWSTTWGKVAATLLVVVGLALGAGFLFDRAAQATARSGSRAWADRPVDDGSGEVDALSAAAALLERAREHADKGKHAKAEAVLRQLLESDPDGELASSARFHLGDSLERQGRRAEALATHQDNANTSEGEWADRSRAHGAELLAAEGRNAEAQAGYEAVVASATAPRGLRAEAQVALARVFVAQGRMDAARHELEMAQDVAVGTDSHDEARLMLAQLQERAGETITANALFGAVRDTTDHRSQAFRRAKVGFERTNGLIAAGATSNTAQAVPTFESDPWATAQRVPAVDSSWEAEAASVLEDAWAAEDAAAEEEREAVEGHHHHHGDDDEHDDDE